MYSFLSGFFTEHSDVDIHPFDLPSFLTGMWASLGRNRARPGHRAWYWAQRKIHSRGHWCVRQTSGFGVRINVNCSSDLTTASCVASFLICKLGVMINYPSPGRVLWDSSEPEDKVLCKLWKVSPGQGVRLGSSQQHTGNAPALQAI